MATIGHRFGFTVFASKTRCPEADEDSEWAYDHHWRVVDDQQNLLRIPLAMEIEWGFGQTGMFEKIKRDYLKLVHCRADLRVMVFQGNGVSATVEQLKLIARSFQPSQPGDRYLFVGWEWGTKTLHCERWAM